MKTAFWLVVILAIFIPERIHASPPAREAVVGMYVHTHWPYNHPYAARTWTFQDWQGYLTGLRELGYNTVLFWPLIETMPRILTASDKAHLQKISEVIDFAQNELGMRFHVVLCPNLVADDAVAIQAEFEHRHFFHSDLRIDPKNLAAVEEMLARRVEALRPLANADAIVIIDSDPGGYPGSTNQEFVDLLVAHRRMLDTLRPGIELVYWMHAGWPAYGRFYSTGEFEFGTEEEFKEVLTLLKAANPEPWSLANNLEAATALGLADRVVNFSYGQIEVEPQFPLTNFWEGKAFKAGTESGPRGIVGNAQSHVLQLPNTLAFARGAQGQSLSVEDFIALGNRLVRGHGEVIAHGWRAMGSQDPAEMDSAAAALAALELEPLEGGDLQGLIFGDSSRFVTDLRMQLYVASAFSRLVQADQRNADLRKPLADFVAAVRPWQERTGYQNQWQWPDLKRILAALNQPETNAALEPALLAETPFGKVKEGYAHKEKQTLRLIEAMAALVKRQNELRSDQLE